MIYPVGDRVLIKPSSPEDKSKGGLVLKTIENEKQNTGTVVSVGDGDQVKRFKEGDKLVYLRYGPQDIVYGKEKYVIAFVDEILAIDK